MGSNIGRFRRLYRGKRKGFSVNYIYESHVFITNDAYFKNRKSNLFDFNKKERSRDELRTKHVLRGLNYNTDKKREDGYLYDNFYVVVDNGKGYFVGLTFIRQLTQ